MARREWHYARQVRIGEDKVAVLAAMIRDIEKKERLVFPFETIREIARKNNFTDDEVAELEVMYF